MPQKSHKKTILAVSMLIIIFIILTIIAPDLKLFNPEKLAFLPKLNVILNTLSLISLIIALIAIKSKKVKLHVSFIFMALLFTGFFLISYLLYHFSTPPTKFSGEGLSKTLYLFILMTHIPLAAIIIPLVMFTIQKAIQKDYKAHKKFARWTAPIWLYVSFTGILIYWFHQY